MLNIHIHIMIGQLYSLLSFKLFQSIIEKHWNSKKVEVIINAAVLKTIDDAPDIATQTDKPVIIYAGGLTRIRGITELVQTMEIVGERATIWLLGLWESESYKNECEIAE